MSLVFQSLRSGSSGNSLLLETRSAAVLLDAGFRSQREFRAALDALDRPLDAVVVSHLHADHINYSALRVLEERRVPVYVYEEDFDALRRRYFQGRSFEKLDLRPFGRRGLALGDLVATPFELPHFGEFHTFGFELHCVLGEEAVKLVTASDLSRWDGLVEWFHDSDFIYVESNHDPELLRRRPNPNSRHHLRNERCGWLLRRAFDGSRRLPQAVMLGHLSQERNEPGLALRTVKGILAAGGYADVPVLVAPRFEPSERLVLAE